MGLFEIESRSTRLERRMGVSEKKM